MEKKVLKMNEIEMEMITLTEEEKKYAEELENNLAGGGGIAIICACRD